MTLVIQKTAGSNLVLANGQKVPVDLQGFGSVSLLLHGNGANNSTSIIDSSLNAQTVSRFGDTKISTVQSKFGGSSIFFDGTGDYLTLPVNATNALGDRSFTLEFWFWADSLKTDRILSWGVNAGYYGTRIDMNSGVFNVYASTTGTSHTVNSGSVGSYTAQQWHHVAIVRNASAFNFYVNGTSVYSTTLTGSLITGSGNSIGQLLSYGDFFTGYIDDFRLSMLARYTANFTPPTAPFPDI